MGGKNSGRKKAPREHGTIKGARQHRYNNETLCEPCRQASADYQRSKYVPVARTKQTPEEVRAKQQQKYRERRAIVNAWKLQQKQCADCGWQITPQRLIAIDCDHIDPTTKTFDLSTAIHKTHNEIATELNKCVARCKNCHAIRTHQEQHHLHRNTTPTPTSTQSDTPLPGLLT